MHFSTSLIRRIFTVVVVALGLLSLLALPAAAGGDSCYPDGCTPPSNPEPTEDPTCGISLTTGQSGDQVTATVSNVPAGGTVRILFDGDEVASNASDEQAAGPLFFRGAAADVELTFTVPDVAPGTYAVVAVGDTFSVTCGDGEGNTGFQVLAADATRGDGDGDDDGSLAFTGGQIILFLAVAAGLIGLGWFLVSSTRSRRLSGR